MNTGKLIEFPEPNRLGDCPVCGRNNGYLNVFKTHWYICRKHRLKWYAGYDLFPTWRQETRKDWERNLNILSQYTEVMARYRTRPSKDEGRVSDRRRRP